MIVAPGPLTPAPFIWADQPMENDQFMGYNGFREAARWTGPRTGSEFAVLEVIFNAGGTGAFSSIVQLE